jgi:hypothetical protein
VRTLLAVALLLQAAPAQSEAEKSEAALKKFGDRTYIMALSSGDKMGRVTMKTRIEKEGGRRVAVFEETMIEPFQGGKVTGTMIEKAALDGLRLLSIKWEKDTIKVEGTKATLVFDGKKETLDVTETVIGEMAVLRKVCAAEQKEGAEFKVDVLNPPAHEFQAGRTFRCEGKVQIELGGRKQEAFRWKEKSQEGQTGMQVDNTYWVSPAGFLLKYIGLGGIAYSLEAR